jgi:response regulator of citrate/malate metabolism
MDDKARSGYPSTMHTPEDIEWVWDLLQQSHQFTIQMLSEKLNISKTACHKVLHEDLDKRKLKARLILHSLTH